MNGLRSKKEGFTMVELLVVLVIIGILAAVATPIFLGNTQKAKASEAVATMSLIRQAQRDYFINNNTYLKSIDQGDIGKPLPNGVAVNTGVTQYFGNDAFSVVAIGSAKAPFSQADPDTGTAQAPNPQDFVVRVDGNASKACASGSSAQNCALKKAEVKDFRLEMDNSGRTFVSYDAGSNWQKY